MFHLKDRHRHQLLAHACSAPFAEIRDLVQYFSENNDEQENFEKSDPRPGHIWPSVKRVRDWLDEGGSLLAKVIDETI